MFQPEKRARFQKSYRRRHPKPLRARTNITPQTYGTEEVWQRAAKYLHVARLKHGKEESQGNENQTIKKKGKERTKQEKSAEIKPTHQLTAGTFLHHGLLQVLFLHHGFFWCCCDDAKKTPPIQGLVGRSIVKSMKRCDGVLGIYVCPSQYL